MTVPRHPTAIDVLDMFVDALGEEEGHEEVDAAVPQFIVNSSKKLNVPS